MTFIENTLSKGAVAPTTPPNQKNTTNNFNDNTTHNQRIKLLNWLHEKGSITTAQAREHLDIMSPAPRIMELRKAGHLINTIWDSWTSEHGINHRVGRYVLIQEQLFTSEVE